MSWGYIADDNRTWANGGSDANLSIRQYDGSTYGNGLAYKFSLPNGTYRVSIGFDDPWNDTNRSTDIVINDQVVETDYVIGSARDIKQYEDIFVQDGEL